MTKNLSLWESVERTDPEQTKKITGKPYQGNSPKPYYLVRKATETFGPAGIGWGFSIVNERVEDGAEGYKVHIAHVRVWYIWGGERGEVEHLGQTMFAGRNKNGAFTDEDAPKKSVTDALVKALSLIGFAGDIFMGRYDDSKYMDELRRDPEPANGRERAPKRDDIYERNSIPSPDHETPAQAIEKHLRYIDKETSLPKLKAWWERERANFHDAGIYGALHPEFLAKGQKLASSSVLRGPEAA